MLIFDDGLGVSLFFMERFSPFHDYIGVVVHLDRITNKDSFICSNQGNVRINGFFLLGGRAASNEKAGCKKGASDLTKVFLFGLHKPLNL